MYSVTKRISMIKQPRGGYINKKELVVTQLDDGITLNENENIHASLVGLAVDYMTRFLMGAQKAIVNEKRYKSISRYKRT